MGDNRIDWAAIQAEYIAGGISQRKLAAKHGISQSTLLARAKVEQWATLRQKARDKAVTKALQKTADAAADNAATAQRIKAKLLARLEKEIDQLPENQIGTSTYRQNEKIKIDSSGRPIKERSGIEFKLREFAAAYKDLTADIMPEQGRSNELLQSLLELEKRGLKDGN